MPAQKRPAKTAAQSNPATGELEPINLNGETTTEKVEVKSRDRDNPVIITVVKH